MDDITARERLLRVLSGQPVDRPPVVCSGGMVNAAITEVTGSAVGTEAASDLVDSLPAAHADAELMADLAGQIQRATGFENLGVPFCLTVEAEALGSRVDHGSLICEPKVVQEAFATLTAVPPRLPDRLPDEGRIQVVVEAVRALAARDCELPIVANVSGPISTAASLVEPTALLKGMRRNPEDAHRLLSQITDFLLAYAVALCEAGATVVAVGDPTGTGEILGPKLFAEYTVPYVNRLVTGIKATGTPALVHICGDLSRVRDQIPALGADAISTDAMVNLPALKRDHPQLVTMGNVSTFMLEFSNPARIEARTRVLVRDGVDIISPACGLSTATTLANIRAITDTVSLAGLASARSGSLR
jgi:[methyl-Co(III) methanol-specific corrinoid protein]:coenzyme M methyltransferase